jgi:hypothetical protein
MWFRITLFGEFNFPVTDLFHTAVYGLEIEDFHSQINGAHEQIAESSCDCMPLAKIQLLTGCVEQRPYDCHSSSQEIFAFQGT